MTQVLVALDIGTSAIKSGVIPLESGGRIDLEHMRSLTFPACYKRLSEEGVSDKCVDVLDSPVPGMYGHGARAAGGGLHRNPNIYDSDVYKTYVFSTMAELLHAAGITEKDIEVVEMAVGFPVSHESRAPHLADYLENGGHPWPVRASNTSDYDVTISAIYAQVQPYYIGVDQVYAWKRGKFDFARGEELMQRGGWFVVDWGSNSFDMRFQAGSLAESGQGVVMKGTYSLLPKLKAAVYSKTHANIPDHQLLHDVFRSGSLLWDGEYYDLTHEIQQIVRTQWESDIRVDFAAFLESLPSAPDSGIVGGGGAFYGCPVMQESYPTRFPGGIFVAKDDEGRPSPVGSVQRGMAKQLLVNAGKREQGKAYHDIRGQI